jgi:hypothetical protein
MQTLEEFGVGDGAHRGLSDWYPEHEQALRRALDAHAAFDTGWYGSKHEIASARIWSEDGVKIKVEASVSDDFDTNGAGYRSTTEWTLDAVASAVDAAWDSAQQDQEDNTPYVGFSLMRDGYCLDYYLFSDGTYDTPPGDYYHWWGWQQDEGTDGQGIPPSDLPLPAAAAFENWARRWAYGETTDASFAIGAWSIKPWENARPLAYEDPNDYVGMGWVDSRGRP